MVDPRTIGWLPSMTVGWEHLVCAQTPPYRLVIYHDFRGNKGRGEGSLFTGDALNAKRLYKVAVLDGDVKMDIVQCLFWHASFKSDRLPAEFRCDIEDGGKRVEIKLNSCVGEFHFLLLLKGGLYVHFSRRAVNPRRESTSSPNKFLENELSSLSLSPELAETQPSPSPALPHAFLVPKLETAEAASPYAYPAAASPLNGSLSLEFPISAAELPEEVPVSHHSELNGKISILQEQLMAERRRSALLEEQLAAERQRVIHLQAQLGGNTGWGDILRPQDDDYLS